MTTNVVGGENVLDIGAKELLKKHHMNVMMTIHVKEEEDVLDIGAKEWLDE